MRTWKDLKRNRLSAYISSAENNVDKGYSDVPRGSSILFKSIPNVYSSFVANILNIYI